MFPIAAERAYKELVESITPADYDCLRRIEKVYPGTLGWGLTELIKE